MKGADSHGSCKNYYKNFVIAGAYMPDNHTAGGYVHHMAVCNGISYPVGNHLYHSCIGVWIRTGNRHRGIQNACNGLLYCMFCLSSQAGLWCGWKQSKLD